MNIKTKTGIGIALVVLMVAALAAPVSADYEADDTKMNIYQQGEGDLSYTYGTPFYQCIWGYDSSGSDAETATYNIDLAGIPNLANLIEDEEIEARLYVYWSWSAVDVCDYVKAGEYKTTWARDYAVYPELEVEFNGGTVPFDYADGTNWIDHYTDSKDIAAVGLKYGSGLVSYNYPTGTNCSMIPLNLLSGTNTVNVKNVKPYQGPAGASYCTGSYYGGTLINSTNTGRARVCIQGIGLLLIYPEVSHKQYWIAEGNDMTYVFWNPSKCKCTFDMGPPPGCTKTHTDCKWSYGINPEDATTKVTFEGPVSKKMEKATLTSVIPTGDSLNNRLYFNSFYNYWGGLWIGDPSPDLSVSETDVSANLFVGESATNVAGFQNGIYPIYPYKTDERQMNVANAFLVAETED